MLRGHMLRIVACGWLLSGGALVADAQAPWEKLRLFDRIDADPEKSYTLTETQGPWMIMAVTFTGDKAMDEARELVLELRSRYKLHAYTHRMHFDFDGDLRSRGQAAFHSPRVMKHRVDEITEVAVLVGNYPTAEDPTARKTLERIKLMTPDCLDLAKLRDQNRTTSRPLAGLRIVQQALLPEGNEKKNKGPMGHAFITTNPILPPEYFAPKGLDPLVVEMNRRVPHSLLDCRGRYTVKVATFTGKVVVDQRKIDEVESGKREMQSGLARAAEKAHRLTEALRAKGYEAYEFHDLSSSIVTVGSFDSVGTPRADGKIEINPQVHAIMETFGAPKTAAPGQQAMVGQPKTVMGIFLDVQPLPVEVPRETISASLAPQRLSFR